MHPCTFDRSLSESKTIDALTLFVNKNINSCKSSRTIDALILSETNDTPSKSVFLEQLKNPTCARGLIDELGTIVDYDDEHWIYQAGSDDPQFQAINCEKCGEYIYSSVYIYISQKCICQCKFL